MHTTLRLYQSEDVPGILELFLLNTPEYFHPGERVDLERFLKNEADDYYVIAEDNGRVIASGGNMIKGDTGWLSWYIVHPDCQNQGLGITMVRYNIRILKKHACIKTIKVRTSQLVYKFYEKAGFSLLFTEKDYWAKGLDLYEMELR